jgi:hypothetical protein
MTVTPSPTAPASFTFAQEQDEDGLGYILGQVRVANLPERHAMGQTQMALHEREDRLRVPRPQRARQQPESLVGVAVVAVKAVAAVHPPARDLVAVACLGEPVRVRVRLGGETG